MRRLAAASLAIAAALLTWILLDGTNHDPLHRPRRLAKGCLRSREQTQKPLIMGVSRGFCVCSAWFGLLAGSS